MLVEDDSLRSTLLQRWSLSSTSRRPLFSLDETSMAKRAASSHENRLLHHRLRLIFTIVDDDSLRSTVFQRWSLSSTSRRPLFSLDETSLTKRTTSSREKRLLHHRLRLNLMVVEDDSLRAMLFQRWSLSSTRKRPLFSLDETSLTKHLAKTGCSTIDCDSFSLSSTTTL